MPNTMYFDGIKKEVIDPYIPRPPRDEKGRDWVLIYEHRNGNRVQSQWAPVSPEAAEKVEKEGLIVECEILSTGEIALYCHYRNEESYGCRIADNHAGDREPSIVLTQMIIDKDIPDAKII